MVRHPHPRTGRGERLFSMVPLILAVALPALALGCDTNARFNVHEVKFDRASIVSAVPAVKVGNEWIPQCAPGNVEGMLVSVVLESTKRITDVSTDKDRSIRPLDRIRKVVVDGGQVRDIKLTGTTNLDLGFMCLEQASDQSQACAGGSVTGSQEDTHYLPFIAGRPDDEEKREGHDVIFVVDQSGSIKGFVDKFTLLEHDPNTIPQYENPLWLNASDYNNLRLTAVKDVITDLNERDRVGVIGFGEGIGGELLEAPCDLPEAAGLAWKESLDVCFKGSAKNENSKKPLQTGIDDLASMSAGRSNLWHAVSQAYDYLRTDSLPGGNPSPNEINRRTKHIIVIADGPDTCEFTESYGQCQPPCGQQVNSQDVMAKIAADAASAPRIRIHFVQFESKGYLGPDPAQAEVACMTEGLYQFIPSNNFASANPNDFREALREGMLAVRYALQGYWRIAMNVPLFESNSGAPMGTPRGHMYSLSGQLDVTTASNLVTGTQSFLFTGGQREDDNGPLLMIRKACEGLVDCGADPTADEACNIYCSTSSYVCVNGAAGIQRADGTPCANGDGGVCCNGQCLATGATCETCN